MSRTELYESVYDVLDALRVRPGMFLGNKSVALLQAFLAGLTFSDLDSGTPSFWDFPRWFEIRARTSSTFPWQRVEAQLGVEGAFDKYFEYLDEFRANTASEIDHARPPFRANFTTFVNGVQTEPEIPERIALIKLIPSGVVFLQEYYAGRPAHSCGAQAFHNVNEARLAAEQRWAFEHQQWDGDARAVQQAALGARQ
jgi:hypothetical protein